jgi:hypothetical protein
MQMTSFTFSPVNTSQAQVQDADSCEKNRVENMARTFYGIVAMLYAVRGINCKGFKSIIKYFFIYEGCILLQL